MKSFTIIAVRQTSAQRSAARLRPRPLGPCLTPRPQALGPRPSRRSRPRGAGFTLAEVLVAMAVFLMGFIAVAAIFPAAALLQKQTVDMVQADQVARNVKAMLKGRRFSQTDLLTAFVEDRTNPPIGSVDITGYVHRFASQPPDGLGNWYLKDRSYPVNTSTPYEADLFWVPLVRDANLAPGMNEWQVFAFILQPAAGASYVKMPATDYANPELSDTDNVVPGVLRQGVTAVAPDEFQFTNGTATQPDLIIGDWLLDNNGVIYRVAVSDPNFVKIQGFISFVPAEPDEIWYAPPGAGAGTRSPCKQIILLIGADAVATP